MSGDVRCRADLTRPARGARRHGVRRAGAVHQPAGPPAGGRRRSSNTPTATTTSPPRCRHTTGSSCAARPPWRGWRPPRRRRSGPSTDQRRDGRAHLGAGDPLHRRQVVHLLRRGHAEDVWRIRMYVLENTEREPAHRLVDRAGPAGHAVGDLLTRRLHVRPQRSPLPDLGAATTRFERATPTSTSRGCPTRGRSPAPRPGSPPRRYDWETRGYRVNEGPAVIQRNGRVFLTYSASATDANYCLGMLTASSSTQPAQRVVVDEERHAGVHQQRRDRASTAPATTQFTVSEDGQSDILVYHDRNYRDISGDPLNDPNRRTRLQKLYWNADGTPNFGIPVPDGVTPYRLRSYNDPRPVRPALGVPGPDRGERDQPGRLAVPHRDRARRQRHGFAGVDQLPRLLPAAQELRGVGGTQRRLDPVPDRRELLPARRPRRLRRRLVRVVQPRRAATSASPTP